VVWWWCGHEAVVGSGSAARTNTAQPGRVPAGLTWVGASGIGRSWAGCTVAERQRKRAKAWSGPHGRKESAGLCGIK
jgi:hypothetical protein